MNEKDRPQADKQTAAQAAYFGELLWLVAAQLNALVTGEPFHVPDWFELFSHVEEETGDVLQELTDMLGGAS